MEDLLAENFVAFTSDQIGDSLSPLTVFRDQHGFTGRIVAASPSLDEVRRLIFVGYGIGCPPEHIVRDDLTQQRLWRLPQEEGLVDVDVDLLWHCGRKMNAAAGVLRRHGAHDAALFTAPSSWLRAEAQVDCGAPGLRTRRRMKAGKP